MKINVIALSALLAIFSGCQLVVNQNGPIRPQPQHEELPQAEYKFDSNSLIKMCGLGYTRSNGHLIASILTNSGLSNDFIASYESYTSCITSFSTKNIHTYQASTFNPMSVCGGGIKQFQNNTQPYAIYLAEKRHLSNAQTKAEAIYRSCLNQIIITSSRNNPS